MSANIPVYDPNSEQSLKPLTAFLLDWFERIFVAGIFGWFVVRCVDRFLIGGEISSLLPVISEGLVVVFILIRRHTQAVSKNPLDWFLAIFATTAPLMVVPVVGRGLIHSGLVALLILTGILVQLYAKITLGRCFGLIPSHRGLKLRGPYRLVRHPMYAGYLLAHIGILCMSPTLWNLCVYAVCYSLQIPRLFAEERILSRDPSYVNYSTTVRYRLIPGVF